MPNNNGAVIDQATIRASVTADETRVAKQNVLWMGNFSRTEPLIPLLPNLADVINYHGVRTRDMALYSTLDYEDKWANAVSIASTKCASLEYDVEGDVELRKVRSHDILANVNGMQGWTPFISKHMQDFLCTDNGAFIEIVRASSAIGSRILGLLHLDSARCVRTGDPARPVIYVDRLGTPHLMKAHEVIDLCDMPSPRTTFNGSGRCSARRVYRTIYRMAVIEQYVAEKVSGQRPLTWYLLNGITQKQIDDSLKAAKLEADSKGLVSFMGASVTSVPTTEDISLVEIPFSSLPDGFDLEAERSNARLEYANAIGLDIQDLQPGAIGGSLGSSTQSEVLNEKSKGKGLAYWRKAFTEQMNLKVLPDATTFLFVEKDYRDDLMAAQAQKARIDNLTAMKGAGMLDAETAVKIAIDAGDLPPDTKAPKPLPPVVGVGPDGKPLPVAAVPAKGAQSEKPKVLGSGEKPQAETTKEVHSGAMVALYPTMDDAESIAGAAALVAWPVGVKPTEPQDMHLTLAYLGEAADISDTERVRMIEATRKLAQTELTKVRFNGIARFNGSAEDGDAIVVLLSEVTLNNMAESARLYIGNASEHPFLAHMTLAYIPKDAPTPTVPPMFETLNLNTLGIAFAGETISFELMADTPLGSIKSHGVAQTFVDAFKANRAELAHLRPGLTRPSPDRQAYAEQVTSELRGYLQVLVSKCKELCPADSGDMRKSIAYAIKNANTVGVEGYVYAGNKARPEAVIRSNLFGRRGFGPTDPDGVLAFEGADGETVFTTHVNAADGNNWFADAWKQTEAERVAMTKRIGAMRVSMIGVGDVPLDNAPHIDGYNDSKGETVPNTARNRRAGGQA